MFWGWFPVPVFSSRKGKMLSRMGRWGLYFFLHSLSSVRVKLTSIRLSPKETKSPQCFLTHCRTAEELNERWLGQQKVACTVCGFVAWFISMGRFQGQDLHQRTLLIRLQAKSWQSSHNLLPSARDSRWQELTEMFGFIPSHMSQLDALNSAELPQHSSSHQPPLVWNNFWHYLVHLVPKAKILTTRLLILITTWRVENKTSYTCHLPQGEKKKKKRVKTNQQNTEHCTGTEIQPPSNKTVSAAFLPSCVCVSLFLRAIKFSILGTVSCFIDQAVGFARSCLERDTSFWRLPGCPN